MKTVGICVIWYIDKQELMSRQEVNSEIQKILSKLSDDNLQTVLTYLKQAQMIDNSKLRNSKNLGKILKEDAELLKRLAQ